MTKFGGSEPGMRGYGTVFKLVPSPTGWTEVVLHRFAGGSDGFTPTGELVRSKSGRVFGMVESGAISSVHIDGTVFEIAP